ncbi:MAG: hypothetical protein LUD15_05205, partial [Bacteroides sp.]|nr:hypothetical protein [Bacteroides sp.]
MTGLITASAVEDELIFGNASSEKRHSFTGHFTEAYTGGLREPARRMLPYSSAHWEGGTCSFRMRVNPVEQNYFTVRLFGDETDRNNILFL